MTLLKPPITFQGSEPAIADHVNTVIADIYYELNNLGGRGGYAYRSITGDSIRTNTIDQSNVNNTIVTANSGVIPVNMNSVPVIINPEFTYADGYLNWGASLVEVNGITYMLNEGAAMASEPLSSENWYFHITIFDGSPAVEAGVSAKSEVMSVMEQGYRRWHMYHLNYNGGNVIITPIALSPVMHAELLEAGTVSADKLQAGMIYTENINVGGVVVDEDGNYVSGSGLYADTTGNVVIGGLSGDDGVQTYYQSAAPSSPNAGDLWYDTDDWSMRRYDGSTWKLVSDVTGQNTAANTANVGAVASSTIAGWAHSEDTTKINGGMLKTGTVLADTVVSSWEYAGVIVANQITSGTLDCSLVTVNKLSASRIMAGTLDCSDISVTNLTVTGLLTVNSSGAGVLQSNTVSTSNIQSNAITEQQTVYSVISNYVADSGSGTIDKWRGLMSLKIPKKNISAGVHCNISGHMTLKSLTSSNRHIATLWAVFLRGNSIVKNGTYAWICLKDHTSDSSNNPATIDTLNPLDSDITYYWVPIVLTTEELESVPTWATGQDYTAHTYRLPLMGISNQYAIKQSVFDSIWYTSVPVSFGCTPVGDGTEDGYIVIYGVDSLTTANFLWFENGIFNCITIKR